MIVAMTDLITVDTHERPGGTLVELRMEAGENRWNTTFTRAFAAALDEVEAVTGPAVLITTSADEKFFSNGLDLDWIMSGGGGEGGEREAFGPEYMALLARIMTLGLPTVSAVNGHCFGAGLMVALCHDIRIMRADRGYLCANELEIGLPIPEPELAMFAHKLSPDAFHQTVVLARRWTGSDALAVGMVQQIEPQDRVVPAAMEAAEGLLRVAGNRTITSWTKERLYGENATLNQPHGPAYLLRHPDRYASGPDA